MAAIVAQVIEGEGYNITMTILTHRYSESDDLWADVLSRLRCSVDQGKVPVVLVSALNRTVQVKQSLAWRGIECGVRVETANAWIEDQWELYGDGRHLVSALERKLLMGAAIEAAKDSITALAITSGVVDMLSDLARDAQNVIAGSFKEASKDSLLGGVFETPFSLNVAEQEVVSILLQYEKLLEKRRLIEASCALQWLAENHPCPPEISLLDARKLPSGWMKAFEVYAMRELVADYDYDEMVPEENDQRDGELKELLNQLFRPVEGEPVRATGSVRVLLPAGRYAKPFLLLEEISRLIREFSGSRENESQPYVMVATPKPRELFIELGDPLSVRGISSAVTSKVSFDQTEVGRVFITALSVLYSREPQVERATDLALSSFSGVGIKKAHDLNRKWRSNRLVTAKAIIDDLCEASALVQSFVGGQEIREGSESDSRAIQECCGRLLTYLKSQVFSLGLSESDEKMQTKALSQVESFLSACQTHGIHPMRSLSVLSSSTIEYTAQAYPQGKDIGYPAVVFCALEAASQQPIASCSALILTDLETTSYSLRMKETSADLLLEKLGAPSQRDVLHDMRRTLFNAMSIARDYVVIERVLHTEEGSESYPAAIFDEIIDCYRLPVHSGLSTSDVDRETQLPLCLMPSVVTAGEDALRQNLLLGLGIESGGDSLVGDGNREVSFAPASLETVSDNRLSSVVVNQSLVCANHNPQNDVVSVPTLSASALEAYLDCPLFWFSARRLSLDEVDARFGAREKGSFAHRVLEKTFSRMKELNLGRVSEDNLEQAQVILSEEFFSLLEEQSREVSENGAQNSSCLIPQTELERIEVERLREKLLEHLEDEVSFLPGFVPFKFEYQFEDFEYAGCRLRGIIDRIDINERNQAVIIDYKGSIGNSYDVSSMSEIEFANNRMLPNRVQTLVYAQVVQQLLGVRVVGALYVSYEKRKTVSGSYDTKVLGPVDLWGVKPEKCGFPYDDRDNLEVSEYSQLIDLVENEIAAAAKRMQKGVITPSPREKGCCRFCPVLGCSRRKDSAWI